MNTSDEIRQIAGSGELWAQRMLVGSLTLAAGASEYPAAMLDAAIVHARDAVAHGDEADFASLLHVLVKRGALPNGVWAGGEAIARLEAEASVGNEECAAQLQKLSDSLPPEYSKAFFAFAQDLLKDAAP